jgi:acetyltransferase-like isoleucine patch superfamily enzyme
MSYRHFHSLGKLYTKLIKKKFYRFGKNSVVKPILNSSNEKYISIGNNVDIGAFCRITVATQFGGHMVKSENKERIKIGDNVSIGNNSFISANNNIEIGNNVILSAYVFISDHDHGFRDMKKNLNEQPLTEGSFVRIGDNVFLGVKSSVLKNVTIGERAVIAANAVVTKDVPAYSMAAGNPARIIKKYDFEKKDWVKVQSSE